MKNLLIAILGLIAGISLGYLIITYFSVAQPERDSSTPAFTKVTAGKSSGMTGHEVLGFLPYWLLSKAKQDYSGFITTLDYFSLTPDVDGTILKYTAPGQSEPGYWALTGGKLDDYFVNAKSKGIKLSLTVFDGDQDRISELISDPVRHADNLVGDLDPIISQYGFFDLNLDLEGVGNASPSAQLNYQAFVAEVRKQTQPKGLSLSMDVIPVDFIRNDHLAIPSTLAKYLDKIIVMAYDFHSPSSFVTGPVAPLYGAGSIAEFDTQVAINAALANYDPSKILLGLPFYGYSWETIDNFPRAAIIPSSAIIESSKDVEDLQKSCATCSTSFDDIAEESYIIYKNTDSNTYQQIFYPDSRSVASKISFVNGNSLGGLAIWALGYEGPPGGEASNNILQPIQNYLK